MKLADAKKAVAPTPQKATALAAAMSGAPHFEDIAIAVGAKTVVAKMTLVGSATQLDIEGDVVRAMAERGLEQGVLTEGEYELERYARGLAVAVRDPEKLDEPFGSVDDWGELSREALLEAWRQYSDMRERLDPVSVPMTEPERELIKDAIVKKNAILLRSFGARRLSDYLLTSADPPASSPIPTSPSGEPSPAS